MNRFRLAAFVALLFAIFLPCAAVFAAENIAAEVPRIEDGAKPYLTVFGDVPFDVEQLRAMHPGAHFRHVKENDPIAERYRATVGTFPAIVYQEPDGTVIFKASGKDIPRTAVEVAAVGGRCRPLRPCPTPEPTPAPEPPVAPPVYVDPVPDTVVPDTDESEPPIFLYVVIGVVAGMITAGFGWLREINGG